MELLRCCKTSGWLLREGEPPLHACVHARACKQRSSGLFLPPLHLLTSAFPGRAHSSAAHSDATGPASSTNKAGQQQHQQQQQQPGSWNESGATCIACGIGISLPGFDTAAEQRAHFKTDWHRYNVKRRLHGQPPASEEQFGAMLEDHESQVSSISGSDSSSDEGGEEGAPGGGAGGQLASIGEAALLAGSVPGSQVPQYLFQTSGAEIHGKKQVLREPLRLSARVRAQGLGFRA